MNFTTIDFETACENKASICSVGITVVENGEIVDNFYSLINPVHFGFKNVNVSIHGITPQMVKNAPTLDSIYPIISNYLKGNVVAHGKSFDFGCLYRVASLYDFELPSFICNCSISLANNFFDGSKLNALANFFNIEFKHHNALEDAQVCAKIILGIANLKGFSTFNEISTYCDCETSERFFKRYEYNNWRTSTEIKAPTTPTAQTEVSSFFEEPESIDLNSTKFLITGEFETISRKHLENFLKNAGCSVQGYATKATNYIIIGNRSSSQWNDLGAKIKKAITLKEAGQDIHFLTEETALSLLSI